MNNSGSILLRNDFMLYYHNNEHSYFTKRKNISNLWHRTDLKRAGDTFYTLEPPLHISNETSNRLVVVFSSMPLGNNYFSSNIANRCFTKNYPSLSKHLVSNTYLLRIMDCNLSFGSYYLNTPNYTTFEKDIQDLIVTIRNNFDITSDNTVLYGVSKGGTGALYHSIIADYHSVVVDPLFSLTKYIKLNDFHFTKSYFPEKLTTIFKRLINGQNSSSALKVIIGVPTVTENYEEYSKLSMNNLGLLAINDTTIKSHGEIGKMTMAEQVTLINKFLLE